MSKISFIGRYLNYLIKGKTKFYLHSPFVYDLMTNVIQDNRTYYAYDEIRYLRTQLKKSKQIISVEDFGAGSKKMNRKRKIKDIARLASISDKKGRLLFNLIKYYECKNILELGTSIGLGTAYLAKANLNAKVTTIEGCKNTAAIAKTNFETLNINNINQITAVFEQGISEVVNETFDFIYFDGNHKKEPTLKYFEQLLATANETSIFVFDDINWSNGMWQAWQQIIKHTAVTVSIDLFFVGIVFFKKDQAKQNFKLYF